MPAIARVVASVSRLVNRIGALVVLPMLTVLVTADVILRYGFNRPLSWGLDGSRHLLVLFFLFGLVESFRTGAHVRMELIAHRLPNAAKRAASILYALLILIVFGFLVKKAAEEIPFMYTLPEVSETLHLRIWIFYAIITAVGVLVCLYVLTGVAAVLQGTRTELEEVSSEEGSEDA